MISLQGHWVILYCFQMKGSKKSSEVIRELHCKEYFSRPPDYRYCFSSFGRIEKGVFRLRAAFNLKRGLHLNV